MFQRMRHVVTIVAALAVIGLVGCAKKSADTTAQTPPPEPAPVEFKVASVDLGKHIDADKKVVGATTTFGAKDTIYASVGTEGASSGTTVAAKWTFGDGQLVHESSETIAPTGPAATEFHIVKPDGWPVGKYKLEVSVNGTPAMSKEFEVKS